MLDMSDANTICMTIPLQVLTGTDIESFLDFVFIPHFRQLLSIVPLQELLGLVSNYDMLQT